MQQSNALQDLSLENQLEVAQSKIDLLEKMMINQSRMALMGEMIG